MSFAGPTRALLAVRICPADTGRRVSVRYSDPADGRLTDVVGTLEAWSAAMLSVRRRDGRTSTVPAPALVAGKVVPPDVSAYDVQRLAEQGWRAEHLERHGDWALRWDHGVTRRANSVRVGGDPPVPLARALVEVADWYAARGSDPLLQLPTPWRYDDDLDAAGWPVLEQVEVLTLASERLAAAAPTPSDVTVVAHDAPDAGWLDVLSEVTPAQRVAYRAILTRSPDVTHLAAHDAAGALVGVARASAARLPRGGPHWAGLSCVETVPAARGRGIAKTLLAAAGRWAAARGARVTYLQVRSLNGAASELYARLGFVRHHRYAYRGPSGSAP